MADLIPELIIDLRCLQMHGEERGIPAHAGTVLRLARAVSPLARAARVTGLIDEALPPPPGDIAACCDRLRPNAYLPEITSGLLLNLAPMQPNQDVLGRLLLNPRIAKASLVYDFIPLEQPARYLDTPMKRLEYSAALVWLRRYDLFLPISAATDTRLRDLIGPVRSAVTGVPISLFADQEAAPASAARHILMVGGADERKNAELLIRAHAASPLLQRRRVPLLIAGDYPAVWATRLRAAAAAAGGDPALVEIPGKLPAAALRAAYRAAFCVVTPSFAEGFSLPVVEAMAAGVASLGSDIPAHALLLPEPGWRFAPDDAAALTAMLERLLADEAIQRDIVARQAAIWPRYKAETVACAIWAALATLLPPPAPAVTAGRPRIALVTPLPPERSGVADFSQAFANVLGKRVDLSLFSSPSRAAGAAPASGAAFIAPDHDRVICAIGNSSHYHGIHNLLRRYGAACVCHDSRLLGFHTHFHGHAAAARLAARELGRAVTAAEVAAWAADETTREADFLDEVAAAARPLIFHNRVSVAALRARGKAAAFLPFAIYRDWPAWHVTAGLQAAARQRLGLPAKLPLIASFGFISTLKGIDPALAALALLRDRGLPCHLLWVGDASGKLGEVGGLAARHGVTELVTFYTGFLPEDRYRDFLLAADFGLQLRSGRPGNVSGALQDCIAAGLPSVANDDLAGNLDAPAFIHRVGDRLDPAEIADALAALIARDTPREAYAAARRDYCDAHSMDNYVSALLALLAL